MKQKISKVSKTIISLVIALSLALVSLIGLTVAYFTDSKSYSGTLDFGYIELEVTGDSIGTSGLIFTNSRSSDTATWTGNVMPGDTITMKFNIGLKSDCEPAYYLVRICDTLGFFNTPVFYYSDTDGTITESTKATKTVGKITKGETHPFEYTKRIDTTEEDGKSGRTDTIKVYVSAVQQANVDDSSAFGILVNKFYVNLPEVDTLRSVITNWTDLTSIGFYFTSNVPAGYVYNADLTNSLGVSNLDVYKKSNTEIAFVSGGAIFAPDSCYKMFSECHYLENIKFSNFETSSVSNMEGMFGECYALTTLDVTNFNTTRVENMCGMFYACKALSGLDVSSFDTSNVTDMNNMFSNCSSLTSLDVSSFDTSSATDMGYMFYKTFVSASTSTLTISDKFVIDGSNTFDKATLNTKTGFNTTVTLMRGGVEVTA